VTGIAPAASSSRTTRSAPELHPDGLVYVAGLAPTISRIRTERPRCWTTRRRLRRVTRLEMSPAAVTPHGGPDQVRTKHAASESNTAPRVWNPGSSQTATQKVPPRGFEPQPSTFAESCPSLERWRVQIDLSIFWFVWMTGIAPVTSWLSPTRSAAELHPGEGWSHREDSNLNQRDS
jgi:hypothetical protein